MFSNLFVFKSYLTIIPEDDAWLDARTKNVHLPDILTWIKLHLYSTYLSFSKLKS